MAVMHLSIKFGGNICIQSGELAFLLEISTGVCVTVGSTKFQWARTVVTASTPLMVSEDGRDAVAAVVGLQMNYNKFYEFFVNSTQVCPRDFAASSGTAAASCNLTCASPVTSPTPRMLSIRIGNVVKAHILRPRPQPSKPRPRP